MIGTLKSTPIIKKENLIQLLKHCPQSYLRGCWDNIQFLLKCCEMNRKNRKKYVEMGQKRKKLEETGRKETG